jgi:AraC-like DNA-binding protein
MLRVKDQGVFGRRPDDEREPLRAKLEQRILRHLPAEGDHDTALPGLSFYRRDGFCEAVSALYEPSLSLVIQGRKRVVLGSETYEYEAGQFVLTAVDLPTLSQVLEADDDRPFLSIMLKLDLATVQEISGEIDLHGLQGRAAGPGMVIGFVTADLLDALTRLAGLLDAPRDIPIMGRLILHEVIYRLLLGPAGAQLRQIAMHGTRCNRIAGVTSWLREHHAEPVRIEALAERAAMGVSTLHHHFKAITRMSPLQYQKHIRLHEARHLLLTEPIDASTVAFRVGYETVTQFSREYRRLFGNPPIRDVSRLRNSRNG